MNINPGYTKVELNCRVVRPVLIYFEKQYGKTELQKFIEGTGMTIEYLGDENNWVSFSYFNRLLQTLVDYTKNPNAPFEAATHTATKGLWGFLQSVWTLFGNPMGVYKMVVQFGGRFTKIGSWEMLQLRKNSAIIKLRLLDNYQQTINNCKSVQGHFAGIPAFWGLPLAKIKERQCAAQGADSCIYEITWVNQPARLFGMLGLAGGLLAGFVAGLARGVVFYSAMEQWVMTAAFALLGYFCGRRWDYQRTIKDNIRVAEEQNESLVRSLREIEILNTELQGRVEQRTAALNESNQRLQQTMEDLRNSQNQLVQSEKLASVGRLAAGMAHELNNPMGAIRNYIQEALEDTSQDDLRWESLKLAEKATGRCKQIVADLLTFSRESKEIKAVDMNELCADIILKAREAIMNPGVRIIEQFTPKLPAIKVDYLQVQQALMNIIMNAADAIESKGQIQVRTAAEAGNIMIEVADTGKGMSKEIMDKVFDPFFTTKPAGKGIGLGLAITYNIIKRFNGDIQVSSQEGRGARFVVRLPVGKEA